MDSRHSANRDRKLARLVIYCYAIFLLFAMPGSLSAQSPARAACKNGKETAQNEKIILYKNPLCYFLLLPGPVLMTLFVVIKKKRDREISHVLSFLFIIITILLSGNAACFYKSKAVSQGTTADFSKEIDRGVKKYEAGRFKEAYALFEKAGSGGKIFPILFYNKALCFIAENRPAHAIKELYDGLRFASMDTLLLGAVSAIEKNEELVQQYHPFGVIDPDIPFCIAIIFFNFSGLFLGFRLLKKKSTFTIWFVFSLSVCIASFVFIGYSSGVSTEPYGIVDLSSGDHTGAGLKKIPADNLAPWINLKTAVSLKVLGEAFDYVLAENGAGLKGWIKKDNILMDRGGDRGLRQNAQ